MNWSRQQAPEAHQKRDELDPTAGLRGPPEEMNWTRQQASEAHQKRDELIPAAGPRGPPEEG